jgi:hypothetical protein
MYRLAISLALLIALLAGCGGGGSGDDSNSASPAVAQAPAKSGDSGKNAVLAKAKQHSATKKDPDTGDDDADADSSKDAAEGKPTEVDEHAAEENAFAKLTPKERQKLVTTVARSALLQFGLKLASAKLSANAHRLNILVTRGSACRADATQEPNMAAVMKNAVPGVKAVRFGVAGTGKELGYYVLDCKRPTMPNGPGRVVLNHTGVRGPYIKRFRIDTKRWALEFENQAGSLAVVIAGVAGKTKGDYFAPVGSQKPEAGRKTYHGPGLIEVKVYGAGRWSIRAKELP